MLPNSNVSIHTRPKRRSKAERKVIQDGFDQNLPFIRVWSVGKRLLSRLVPCQLRADRRQFDSSLTTYFGMPASKIEDEHGAWPLIPCKRTMCVSQVEALRPMQQGDFLALGCMGDSTAFLMIGIADQFMSLPRFERLKPVSTCWSRNRCGTLHDVQHGSPRSCSSALGIGENSIAQN